MTATSWLWLGLGFALPLFAFVISSVYLKHQPVRLAMVACLAALIPAVTAWMIIFSSPYWREGTQIVWTGVKATGAPLSIGGRTEESVLGWPNDALEPHLTIAPSGNGASQAMLEIKGGGAFVLDEHQQLLNGEPLAVGGVTQLGDYQIRLNRLGLSLKRFLSPEVEVLDRNGKSLAGFSLRQNRTRSLRFLIAGTPMEDIEGLKDEAEQERAVAERQRLEEWAADIWLFRADDEKVQVLSRNASYKHMLGGSSTLSVKWANMTLTFDVSTVTLPDGVVQEQLKFEAPWRLASPLPPAELAGCGAVTGGAKPGDLSLMVVGSARPCDLAFVLPLRGNLTELRQEVTISPSSAKFTTPDAIDNENPPAHPPGVIVKRDNVGTSQISRVQGAYSFDLATVRNLPSRPLILALILVAWLIYAIGLVLAFPRMIETNRMVIYGLSLVAWNFLCFRLLLSFRYALDPASLDRLSVEGVTLAFIGLTVVPGLMLLIGRLRSDRYDGPILESENRRAMLWALGYLGLLIAGSMIALHAPARLWSDLPETYYVSIFDYLSSAGGLGFLLIVTAVTLLIALHIRYLYMPDDPKGETKGMFAKIFVSSWYWVENYYTESGEFWEARLRGKLKLLIFYFLGGTIIFLIYVVIFWLARKFLPGDKTAQEMSVPLFFFWLTLLWLGLRLFFISKDASKPLKWTSYLMLAASAVLMITLPAVLMPASIADFGSIIPVLAIILPLTWLLIVVLPMKARLCVALALGLIFAGGFMLYQNVEGLIPFQKQIISSLPAPVARLVPGAGSRGRVFARLLNYKQGTGAQRLAISANSIVGGEGLPYQELLNGNQHTWENRALAHAGNWWGMGFGRAPTRTSQVRQDTLQYDSVFSFFIVSEFGMVGGVLLLLMYAVPLILIFMGGRARFDGGYAIAYIIATAFILEGLYHMGMNTGAFPMTGRNLPLLSVNSPTDLARWTILFCFAVTVTFWRYKGQGSLAASSPSLISAPVGGGEPLLRYSLIFCAVPCLFAASVLYSSWGVLADEENELKTYNYKAIMDDVDWYLQNGVIAYDHASYRLRLDKSRLEDPDVSSFLQREIIRFNAEDRVEKEERFRKEYIGEINQSLSVVKTLKEYNDAMQELGQKKAPESRRNIFRLKMKMDEEGNVVDTMVEPNSDFNISFSFQNDAAGRDLLKVKYGEQAIIGPAWVRGEIRSVISSDAKLPWVANLRDAALTQVARAIKNGTAPSVAQSLYGALTLDPALHEAASSFLAARGLQLHESFLASRPIGNTDDPLAYLKTLPPRVALSIVDLTDGKTLALGGWPQMNSAGHQWLLSSVTVGDVTKSYWVPTTEWLEGEAPAGFRARYGGDRNFDHSLVMGSSTKPIWAAAVLKTHPKLGELLLVRGSGGTESSAFGVKIPGKEWKLNSHTGDWVDLTTYLQTSDNRYHVRLGLLGLSSSNDGTIRAAGSSGSPDESLTGAREPWGMYPDFVAPIQIARGGEGLEMRALGPEGRPNQVLANSELARNLRGMFSISISRVRRGTREVPEFGPRRSFWTKNENDDLMANASGEANLFDGISPQAPDFAFDKLTRPRDYITMLMGGGNNLWANVDFAAAFGSCLLGRPVIAHIVANDLPLRPLEERKRLDPAIARKLRAGLSAVVEVEGGTAYRAMHTGDPLSYLRRAGVRIYAKTGTLKAGEEEIETSRIVVALVRWKNEEAGEVDAGLIFSLVVEEGRVGTATEWMRDFIVEHEVEISRLLKIETNPTPPPAQRQITERSQRRP